MRPRLLPALAALALPLLAGCAHAPAGDAGRAPDALPARYAGHDADDPTVEVGTATYYASRYDGRPTASGEPYDERRLTAAHRTLPFGTRVRVTNLANGRSVVVTITDRGPYCRNCVVYVSRRAARALGFVGAGVTRVRLEVLPD